MKRITSIILATLLVVSLFAFVGCSNTDEMQQKIEELQIALQTQTEILTELQNTNTSNATQIANLQTALQEQAKQIEDIQKEIEELSKQNGESRMEELLKHFDLTDPKEYWTGFYSSDFATDVVHVTLRKTTTYPYLLLSDFDLDCAVSLDYIDFKPIDNDSNFRQKLSIQLKNVNKDQMESIIKQIEKLEFVKSVHILYIADNM